MEPLKTDRRLRTTPLRARWSSARGSTLVEAAFITPLLLLLTFATVDFASLFYVYLSLENGITQAARFGITGNQMADPDNPGNNLSREASMIAALKKATPTLTLTDSQLSFSHMSPGAGGWTGGAGAAGDIVRLQVDYTWKPMTPLVKPFFTGGEFHVKVESSMKSESRFN